MQGVYKGIACRTGDQRIDGVWQKALIYECKPEGDDEAALTEAGFTDLENGLWVRVITKEQYRELAQEFEQKRKAIEQEQLVQRQIESEEQIKLETRLHMYNERMASRRAKMRRIKLDFTGISVFSEVISILLIVISVLYRSDPTLKLLALPLWVSLMFMPVIIVGAVAAAVKKLPEVYLVLACVMLITALIAWEAVSFSLVVITAAFVLFYFVTRSVTELKKEPEYPYYFNKTLEEFK